MVSFNWFWFVYLFCIRFDIINNVWRIYWGMMYCSEISIIFLYNVIISCNNLDILEKGIRDVCK